MRFIQLCTTDGNVWVKVDDISYILQDPRDLATCMVFLISDKSFECSNTPQEIVDRVFRMTFRTGDVKEK